MTGFADTRRFQIIWKNDDSVFVDVDDAARRLYAGDTIYEVAAAIACAASDTPREQYMNIKDVKEV